MADFAALSPRQRQVASLLAIGLNVREIAANLGISPKTIDTHRADILHRLGLDNQIQLARLAIREGFVSMHDEVGEEPPQS